MALWVLVILGILAAILLLGLAETKEYVGVEEELLEDEVLLLFEERKRRSSMRESREMLNPAIKTV